MKTKIIATAALVISMAFGASASTAPQGAERQQDRTEQVRRGDGDHRDFSRHHNDEHRDSHRKAKAYRHHGRGGNCHHHHGGGEHGGPRR